MKSFEGVVKPPVHCMKLPSLQQLRPVQVSYNLLSSPLTACYVLAQSIVHIPCKGGYCITIHHPPCHDASLAAQGTSESTLQHAARFREPDEGPIYNHHRFHALVGVASVPDVVHSRRRRARSLS